MRLPQELVFRPDTLCQHNVCKVRGRRGSAIQAVDPLPAPCDGRLHSDLPGSLPFRASVVCLWLPDEQGCSLSSPASSQLPIAPPPPCAPATLALAGPSTGRFVPTFLGGHTLVFQHLPALWVQVREAAVLLLPPSCTK